MATKQRGHAPRTQRLLAIAALALCVLLGLAAAWWLRRGGAGVATSPSRPDVARSESAERYALRGVDTDTTADARELAAEPTGAPSSIPAPRDDAHVEVVVVDDGRHPVPGARVELTGEEPQATFETDARGCCVLPLAPAPAELSLRVSAEGFVPECEQVQRAPTLEVALSRSLDVHGRVTTADDRAPVAGARVTLQPSSLPCSDATPEARTDAAGRFELTGLPRGRRMLWLVSAEGFVTLGRETVVRDADTEAEFVLTRGRPLELIVVDAQTGAPVEGAEIHGGLASVRTDAAGRAGSSALLAMGDEETKLSVHAPGYCVLYGTLQVDPGPSAVPVRLPLLAAAQVLGRVLDASGAPVPGARVRMQLDREALGRARGEGDELHAFAEPPDGFMWIEARDPPATSDETGAYRVDGLMPLSDGHRLLAESASGRTSEWKELGPLGPPGSSLHADLVLPGSAPGGVVTGTLRLNGRRAAGNVAWFGQTRRGKAGVDRSGVFRIEGVEPGWVSLLPMPKGLFLLARYPEEFRKGRIVKVADAAELHVDLDLRVEVETIAGRVIDTRGSPIAGVTVRCRSDEAGWIDETTSAADGRFELSARPGTWVYTLYANKRASKLQIPGVLAGTRDLELVFPAPPGGRTLRVRVVDRSTGAPLQGYTVELASAQKGSVQVTDHRLGVDPADPGGWHELQLEPGIWNVFVGDAPHEVSGYLSQDCGEVSIGESDEPFVLELERRRGAEVHVRLAQGQEPWPDDVSVVLLERDLCEGLDQQSSAWLYAGRIHGLNVREARLLEPNAEGRARARGVRPGPCRFVAFPDTIAIEPAEITVTGSETAPVEIRWTPR